MTAPEPPGGFRALDAGVGRLWVDGELADELLSVGLQHLRTWEDRLGRASVGIGRGATARLALPSGSRLLLKQLRRGGLLAPLWRDRFVGIGRLLANLSLPRAARSRGVATPLARALLAVPGPPGLRRGWLALDEVSDARDLATRLVSASPPGADELRRVMSLVRVMHEAGVEHRDLNLGNLLVRDAGSGERERVFVTDLDGARLHESGLPFGLRQRALRRLERSWVKLSGGPGAIGETDWIYDGYAGADAEMARRLQRGRRVGRLSIRLHRAGWRR